MERLFATPRTTPVLPSSVIANVFSSFALVLAGRQILARRGAAAIVRGFGNGLGGPYAAPVDGPQPLE